jgi:hypothetical protein
MDPTHRDGVHEMIYWYRQLERPLARQWGNVGKRLEEASELANFGSELIMVIMMNIIGMYHIFLCSGLVRPTL